ncbi:MULTISPECIES: TonB-dependent receptor [unclassified Sphingomonas]|uniref:TonB-dependent receptor n=1 Tax=Sphingomonas TaxID=13687 RepID=UPI00095E3CAD|nr:MULTISPECIES: TonB-dependent receptor [unclassified Sphingomonas]MBN8809925.1 TonB-dependent receptor [Sphingomonas sp.]OJY50532.1 MAG: TonB-dependent receptor [Sphingomonas sp. 67-41]
MGIRGFLIGTASAMALLTGAAHAQTSDTAAQPADDHEIVVTGFRASLAQSIEAKRKADAIIDSVSSEDVGKFPNTNVAEALTLVPGVTVDRAFGQGEKVSILGTDPALNRTLLNGQTVASADWFILDNPGRTFNYALLAPQLVNRVDVYKSPEPRIDEGSIGGTVNVLTRKPLELKPFVVAGSLSYLYNDRSKKGDVQGSALVSWHNEDKTLGILASFQRTKDRLRRDGLESYGTISANFWAGNNDANTSSLAAPAVPVVGRTYTGNCTGTCASTLTANPNAKFPNAFGTSYFEQGRERLTYSATAQWKPVDQLTITADWLRIDATYDNLNQSMFAFPGNVWNSAGSLTGLTVDNGIVRSATFNNGLSVLDAQYRVAEMHSQTFHGQIGWEDVHWDLNVQGGVSDADGGTKKQVFLEFLNKANYTVDISGAPDKPGTISYTSNVLGNPAAFVTDAGWSGNLVTKPTTDKERYGQVDFGLKFDGVLKRIQVGYKYRSHETAQAYAGVSLAGTNGFAVPASNFDTSIVRDNYLSGFDGINDQMRGRFIINGDSMVNYVQGRPGLPTPSMFSASEFTAGNWDIKEQIHAAYAQANFDAGGFRGNFGVRYVHTATDSAGFVCKPGAMCNAQADWVWQTTKTSYDNVLPSVNIIADVRKDLVFRFAAAQVIARPNYADLTNYFWLSDQILSGGGGNPDLKPYKSNNFNASLEWYLAPRSILSGEIFYKDISNYILQQTAPEQHYNTAQGRVTTYQISRPFNAGSAEVKGFAVAYQQSFPLGFGVLANYTYSDGKASTGADLPYNSRHQASLSPFFESGPVALRATYTWRSKYFTGIDRGDQMYVRGTANVDVSATYNFTKEVGLTLSGMNLTDSQYYAYANTPSLPRGVYKTGRKLLATVNVNF